MYHPLVEAALEAIRERGATPDGNDMLGDALANEALASVDYRPRHLYRLAVAGLQMCVDSSESRATRAAWDKLMLISPFALDMVRLPHHPRDVVKSLARQAHRFQETPGRENVASLTCSALQIILESAGDDRPIVWALREGILHMMVEKNEDGATSPPGQLSGTIRLIMQRSIFLRVARALALCSPPSMKNSGAY